MFAIHIQNPGKSKTLVLFLHGIGINGMSMKHFFHNLPYTYAAPDLPGHVEHQDIHLFEHAIASTAQLIEDALRRQEIEEYIVVGHSLGGFIAAQLVAGNYPPKAAVFLGIGLRVPYTILEQVLDKEKLFIEQHPDATTKIWDTYHKLTGFKDVRTQDNIHLPTVFSFLHALNNFDAQKCLADCNKPLLLLTGLLDVLVPVVQGKALHAAIPCEYHEILTSHNGLLKSDEVKRCVDAFLEKHVTSQ